MSKEPPIQLSLWPLVLVDVQMEHDKAAKKDKRYIGVKRYKASKKSICGSQHLIYNQKRLYLRHCF
jgi:hypothetical protein